MFLAKKTVSKLSKVGVTNYRNGPQRRQILAPGTAMDHFKCWTLLAVDTYVSSVDVKIVTINY